MHEAVVELFVQVIPVFKQALTTTMIINTISHCQHYGMADAPFARLCILITCLRKANCLQLYSLSLLQCACPGFHASSKQAAKWSSLKSAFTIQGCYESPHRSKGGTCQTIGGAKHLSYHHLARCEQIEAWTGKTSSPQPKIFTY